MAGAAAAGFAASLAGFPKLNVTGAGAEAAGVAAGVVEVAGVDDGALNPNERGAAAGVVAGGVVAALAAGVAGLVAVS